MLTGNDDFKAGPHIIEFSTNTTMVVYSISITNDRLLEIDETFNLSIDQTLLIPQVFLGNISEVVAMIIDDDRKYKIAVTDLGVLPSNF